MTLGEVRHLIRQRTEAPGGQRGFAKQCGVSDAFISMVIHGKKRPSQKILDALNLKKQVHYISTIPDHSTTRTLRVMAGQTTTESEDHHAE